MEEDIEISPEEEESVTGADKQVWDQDMTFCLINEYRNHLQDFLYPQGTMIRDIWEKISLNMHAKGYGITAGVCDQKWRQLKKTFKYNQLGTGKGTKPKWIYYNALEDILNNEEITKRISWKQRSTIKQNSLDFTQDEDLTDEETVAHNSSSNNKTFDRSKIGDKNPPKWFDVFLKQYEEDQEQKRKTLQKMHSDLVALERQKCILLENLIKKIPKPETIPKIIEAVSLSQEVFENDEELNCTFNGV